MLESPIDYTTRGALAFITLNRPERLNAINRELTAKLEEAVARANREPDVRVIVLRGAGRAFCAGSDLKELHSASVEAAHASQRSEAELGDELETSPLPTIAAINGYALGGGFALALSHDIRVASESAIFGAPEVKLGWSPPFGIAQAVRILGETAAKDLLMSGRNITAQEALQMGVVSHVLPGEQLITSAEEVARRFVDLPLEAVKSCKREVNRVARQLGGVARNEEIQAFLDCFQTSEAQTGLRRFVEKGRGSGA
jgi:enoyl-CoA hydratase/carnithine racemase